MTPPTTDQLEASLEKHIASLRSAVKFIESIDSSLVNIDLLMHKLQPILSGRMRISFVKNGGKFVPQFRIYTRIKSGSWISEFAPYQGITRRLKKSKGFEVNHSIMQEICIMARELFVLRTEMVARLSRLDTSLTNSLAAKGGRVSDVLLLTDKLVSQLSARS